MSSNFAEAGLDLKLLNFDTFINRLERIDGKTKEINSSLKDTSDRFNLFDRRLRRFGTRLNTSSQQFEQLSRSIGSIGLGAAVSAQGISFFENRLMQAERGALSFGNEIRDLLRELRGLNTQLRSSNRALGSFGRTRVGDVFGPATKSGGIFRGELGTILTTFATLRDRLASPLVLGLATGAAGATLATVLGVDATFDKIKDVESGLVGIGKTLDDVIDLGETRARGFVVFAEQGQALREELTELSNTRVPLPLEDLAEIGETIGQLNFVPDISTAENLDSFITAIETSAGLAQTTNLTAEQAARGITQFQNVFNEFEERGLTPGENFERLGSTIVELGNKFATSEALILGYGLRLQGAANAAGFAQEETLGMGAAFSALGIPVEAGGSSVSMVIEAMQKAAAGATGELVDHREEIETLEERYRDTTGQIRTLESQLRDKGIFTTVNEVLAEQAAFLEAGGTIPEFGELLGATERRRLLNFGEELQDINAELSVLRAEQGQFRVDDRLSKFLETTNTTLEDFKRLADEDPSELFLKFVRGLSEQGSDALLTLEELGLSSREVSNSLLSIAGNPEELQRGFDIATGAFSKNSAQADEAAKRYATFDSQLQFVRNNFANLADLLRDDLAPIITTINDELIETAGVFSERIPTTIQKLIDKLAEVDLSGFQVDLSTLAKSGFDRLDTAIDNIDPREVNQFLQDLKDTLSTLQFFVKLATDNWNILAGVFKGLVVGGIIISLAGAISLLLTPVGLTIAAVAGLGVLWETNFLGIQETTATVASKVKEGFDKIISSYENLKDILQTPIVPDELAFQIPQLEERQQAPGEGLLSAVNQAIDDAQKLKPKLDQLSQRFDGLTDAIQGLRDTANEENLEINVEKNLSAFVSDLGLLTGFFGAALLQELSAATRTIRGLVLAIDSLITLDGAKARQALEEVSGGFGDFVITIPQIIGEQFEIDLTQELNERWAHALAGLTIAGSNTVTAIQDTGSQLGFKLGQALLDNIFAEGALSDIEQGIRDKLSGITLDSPVLSFSNIRLGAALTSVSIISTFTGLLNAVEIGTLNFNPLVELADSVKLKIQDKFRGFLDSIIVNIPEALLDLADLLDLDTSTIREKQQELIDIGESIPEGIKDGIENNSNQPSDSLDDSIDDMIDDLNAKLEIGSPSQLFVRVGESIIEGLVDGLGNTSPLIQEIDNISTLFTSRLGLNLSLSSVALILSVNSANDVLGDLNTTIFEGDTLLSNQYIPTLDLLDQKLILADESVHNFTLSQSFLGGTIRDQVNPEFAEQIDLVETLDDEYDNLIDRIEELVEQLQNLEDAYVDVGTAIGDLSGPTFPLENDTGDIIDSSEVSQSIPENIPVEVDFAGASNLVAPSIPTAPISNSVVNNSNSLSNNNETIILQIANAPSSNFLESARIARSLSR